MAQGLGMKGIAEELDLSYHIVDSHLRNIYAKLDVHTSTAAVAKAVKDGFDFSCLTLWQRPNPQPTFFTPQPSIL